MYHDILVPTDGSDASQTATDHALVLSSRLEGTLHALSVSESPGAMQRDQLRADAEDEARSAVEAVEAAATEAGVEVHTAVREGTPDEEILAYADHAGVDLIVV